MSKKILVVIIVALVFFTGCGVSQNRNSGTNLSNPQTKLVHIDSEPEGATVYIDNMEPITTPVDVELTIGTHYIKFRKAGYLDVEMKDAEVKDNTDTVSVVLEKPLSKEEGLLFAATGPILFNTVPHFACCSAGVISYSNIFYGGTYTVSGITILDSFDIVFPSKKKIHFETTKGDYARIFPPDIYGNLDPSKLSGRIKEFSKIVEFNELGVYRIVSNGKEIYTFEVDYKPTIVSPTPKLDDIFKNAYKNAIAVPVNGEVEAKVLITDAKGTPILNTFLGVYGLKTNKNGNINFKPKVVRTGCPYCYKIYVNGQEAQLRIYGDLLVWGYDYAKYSRDGKLLEATTKGANVTIQSSMLPTFKDNVRIIYDGNQVFMPYDSIGITLNELCSSNRSLESIGYFIAPSYKNPSVIYTGNFVSTNYGNHFEKMSETLDTIAIHPENPAIILGWSRKKPQYILMSKDFGAHFENISNVNIDLTNNFVEQIAIDPKNPRRVYLATWKGVFVSNDFGKSFKLLTNDFGFVKTIAISESNPNLILLGTEKGIVRSADGGRTFKIVKENYDNTFKSIVFANPDNPKVIFAGNDQGLIVSYDEGKTWQFLHNFDIDGSQSVAVYPNGNDYTIFVTSFRDGLYKSTDSGKTFAKVDFPVGSVTSVAFDSKGTLYVLNDGFLFKLIKENAFKLLDPDTFLKGFVNFKVDNDELYIDVTSIKRDLYTVKVSDKYIEFYKQCDMLP
ncbi:VPS10 domain-containing protein [Caldisericum sp. AR60]|uniref:VPS10 domain-containing protein n=1 Tax=Caldisericum sp. AR60 TaxID=3397852 RepID=UPI0039FD4616